MSNHNSISNNWISSHKWYLEILGALILSKYRAFSHLLLISLIVVGFILLPEGRKPLCLVTVSFAVYLVWQTVRTLTPIYCLRKEEARITWSQVALLFSFACWLCAVIKIWEVKQNSSSYIIVSVIGAVLGWIFQDTIKSVVAFFYLRANNLLKIGDWIAVPAHGIDGCVRGITLTTVTLENWDTTTSAFPTYILHSEHFKNYQKMLEGKTHGRRMMKTFIVDTGWVHTMSREEIEKVKTLECLDEEERVFLSWFIEGRRKSDKTGCMLNIELYRQYIYHWLMNHSHVSHEPRLIVRWLEQVPEGMPLQIYAFLTDSSLAPFEWQQSQIIEHIIEALAWFNLKLYQRVSGYDASNVSLNPQHVDNRRNFEINGEIQ